VYGFYLPDGSRGKDFFEYLQVFTCHTAFFSFSSSLCFVMMVLVC
jgi:hypothetical protein